MRHIRGAKIAFSRPSSKCSVGDPMRCGFFLAQFTGVISAHSPTCAPPAREQGLPVPCSTGVTSANRRMQTPGIGRQERSGGPQTTASRSGPRHGAAGVAAAGVSAFMTPQRCLLDRDSFAFDGAVDRAADAELPGHLEGAALAAVQRARSASRSLADTGPVTDEIGSADTPVCSFCGRSTLAGVAGQTPATFACDDCIVLMVEIREESVKPRLMANWAPPADNR